MTTGESDADHLEGMSKADSDLTVQLRPAAVTHRTTRLQLKLLELRISIWDNEKSGTVGAAQRPSVIDFGRLSVRCGTILLNETRRPTAVQGVSDCLVAAKCKRGGSDETRWGAKVIYKRFEIVAQEAFSRVIKGTSTTVWWPSG